MPMFGSQFGSYRTPPYAEPNQVPEAVPGTPPIATPATPAPVFQPPKRGMFGTAGLIGDILTDSNTTKQRLDEDFQFAQQQFQQQHPAPVAVDGNLIQYDPATGSIHTLFAKPAPAPTGYAGELIAAGIRPGTPDYERLTRQKVENEANAPPIVQHNADGTTTLYQAGAVPRTPTNAPAIGSVIADPRKMGGAAPAMGPGGFPFYRSGH